MKHGTRMISLSFILASGTMVGVWALVSLLAGLKQANWQPAELLRQYLIATGIVKPSHTFVDFYTHIKGIEYLICIGFFVVFPLFYKYVNEDRKTLRRR